MRLCLNYYHTLISNYLDEKYNEKKGDQDESDISFECQSENEEMTELEESDTDRADTKT